MKNRSRRTDSIEIIHSELNTLKGQIYCDFFNELDKDDTKESFSYAIKLFDIYSQEYITKYVDLIKEKLLNLKVTLKPYEWEQLEGKMVECGMDILNELEIRFGDSFSGTPILEVFKNNIKKRTNTKIRALEHITNLEINTLGRAEARANIAIIISILAFITNIILKFV